MAEQQEFNAMSCKDCGREYQPGDQMTREEIERECVDDCTRYD